MSGVIRQPQRALAHHDEQEWKREQMVSVCMCGGGLILLALKVLRHLKMPLEDVRILFSLPLQTHASQLKGRKTHRGRNVTMFLRDLFPGLISE